MLRHRTWIANHFRWWFRNSKQSTTWDVYTKPRSLAAGFLNHPSTLAGSPHQTSSSNHRPISLLFFGKEINFCKELFLIWTNRHDFSKDSKVKSLRDRWQPHIVVKYNHIISIMEISPRESRRCQDIKDDDDDGASGGPFSGGKKNCKRPKVWTCTPTTTNMPGWEITIFNRRYIFIHGWFSSAMLVFQGVIVFLPVNVATDLCHKFHGSGISASVAASGLPRVQPPTWSWVILLMVQKSGDHQSRLVVYPMLYKVLYIPGQVVRDFFPSTVTPSSFWLKSTDWSGQGLPQRTCLARQVSWDGNGQGFFFPATRILQNIYLHYICVCNIYIYNRGICHMLYILPTSENFKMPALHFCGDGGQFIFGPIVLVPEHC